MTREEKYTASAKMLVLALTVGGMLGVERVCAQQALDFHDDFQSGSYWSIDHDPNNTGSTIDDVITIEPVRWSVITPENAGSSNPPLDVSNDHWWWAFEVGGMGGLTPTFQVNTTQAWFGSYGSSYSPVYRYVDPASRSAVSSWHFFDNTTQSGSTFSFSNNTAFDGVIGDVQVSYALPYTPDMAAAHTQSLINHPRVMQTASAVFNNPTPSQFGVIGQTPTGHTDLIRTHRPGSTGVVTVETAYDLLAYTVTDSFVDDANKLQVVLMSGNHASEQPANIAMQGMIDFLTSGHPIAELLLDRAEFHVYPIVDPEGRALGQTRGNDSAQGFGQTPAFIDSGTGSEHIRIIDHNRVWDRTGSTQPYDEVDTVRDAIIRDTSDNPDAPNPTTNIDYLFDFHGFPAGGGGDNTPFEVFESGSNATFTDALRALSGMSSGDILDGDFGAHPGMAERWAFLQGGELDAEHAFTPEIGVAHQSALLQTPQDVERLYLDHGEDYARALAAVLLPANTVVYNEGTPRNWDSAGWETLAQQTTAAPSAVSHALIAAGGGQFIGPAPNSSFNALTVFGYNNTPTTRGNTQPLTLNLQPGADLTITGQFHIENAHVGPTSPGGTMGDITSDTVLLVGHEHAAILEVNTSLIANRVDLLGSGAELRITGATAMFSNRIEVLASEGGHLFTDARLYATSLLLDSGSTVTHTTDGIVVSTSAELAGRLVIADDKSATLGDTVTLIAASTLLGQFDQVDDAIFAESTFGWSLTYLIDTVLTRRLNATVRYAGDATGDDFVGAADLDLILVNWGTSVTAGVFAEGDFTGDGYVGNGDLALVLNNWSEGTPPDINIPEPGTLSLLGAGLFVFLRKRRGV